MLRNLSNTSATSADRRENLPSFTPPPAGTSSKGSLASPSPYTKSAFGARHLEAHPNPAVKMGLMASFAILFLLLASSFASEGYSNESTPLSNLRGADVGLSSHARGAKMTKHAVMRSISPEHQTLARSVKEEGEASFGDQMMGAEDDGMAKSDGPTLGSELVSKMDQTLEANKDGDTSASIQRMLVHSGEISLKSPRGKANEIADQISDLIPKGGYVEDRSESLSYTQWSRTKDRKIIDMKLRVPSNDFHRVWNQIQGLVDKDHVVSVSSKSRDVTDEYIDASARADTLAASRDALKTILTRANSITDVMTVKTELGSMTEQIESLRRRAVYLKKQATLSEINVTIQEEEANTEKVEKKTPGWDPTKPLYMATKDVATLFGGFANAAIYLSVWAIPCGILFVLVRTFCWKKTAYCVSEIMEPLVK